MKRLTLAAAVFVFALAATAPPVPVVNPVTSPTNNAHQTLTGTKESGSGIVINGVEVLPPEAQPTSI